MSNLIKDFLPTVMEVLSVERPEKQRSWAFDGRSILPLLRDPDSFKWRDTEKGPRGIGIGYYDIKLHTENGWGYRFGRWKYVEGSTSCKVSDCQKSQLFDLETDLGERHDLSSEYPYILAHLKLKFQDWHESVLKSRIEESNCRRKDLSLPGSIGLVDADISDG
mmetsp:Transcript_13564/g.21822  ORF Transcript_13564/g.21822 Transcript_13564/m.21822 type:complete len:164 (+) Transcript_13564:13-504(+)